MIEGCNRSEKDETLVLSNPTESQQDANLPRGEWMRTETIGSFYDPFQSSQNFPVLKLTKYVHMPLFCKICKEDGVTF